MPLQAVAIRHFRNIAEADILLAPALTLWLGANGQGKTNGLEAIHVLLTGRGIRPGGEAEWTQRGSAWMGVSGRWEESGGVAVALRYQVAWHPVKKRLREGGVRPVVLFSPDDLALVKGSPTDRRAFLDTLLEGVDPAYGRALRQYQRGLQQRNRAIKDGLGRTVVDRFGEVMAGPAVYVWKARAAVVTALEPRLRAFQANVGGNEQVAIGMKWGGAAEPATDPEGYCRLLAARRYEEEARGMTLVGPHRDDLLLWFEGQPAGLYASQGQARTMALGMKLATHALMEERLGVRPLVLLDDVLSELDGRRREALLRLLAAGDQQAVVTDTGGEAYRDLAPWVYRVEGGRFTRTR
ncbi:MAG: DNA replication and repair protein RecF [Firmicutes bacterium]|nr:DNA replication and repair protein RecF [Alicyclobacillaceae bacterium]MCL6496119.1 DNA replication and repair protein RecF [Bacillota bacterium]